MKSYTTLTFASKSYRPQQMVQQRSIERYLPNFDIKVVDPGENARLIDILMARPAAVLALFKEGYKGVFQLGADVVFYNLYKIAYGSNPLLRYSFHNRIPFPGNTIKDAEMYSCGSINSDYIYWPNTPDTKEFLEWLDEKLKWAYNKTPTNIFWDQIYLSFIPTYYRSEAAPFDYCYHNRAFYNMHEGQPGVHTISIQYSGFDENDPGRISRHYDGPRATGYLLELCEQYAQDLKEARALCL